MAFFSAQLDPKFRKNARLVTVTLASAAGGMLMANFSHQQIRQDGDTEGAGGRTRGGQVVIPRSLRRYSLPDRISWDRTRSRAGTGNGFELEGHRCRAWQTVVALLASIHFSIRDRILGFWPARSDHVAPEGMSASSASPNRRRALPLPFTPGPSDRQGGQAARDPTVPPHAHRSIKLP